MQFTVPTLNTDGSSPADLRRIEVYGHTGPLPTPADFLKYGTLVASIDIAEPPEPKEESKEPVDAARCGRRCENARHQMSPERLSLAPKERSVPRRSRIPNYRPRAC